MQPPEIFSGQFVHPAESLDRVADGIQKSLERATRTAVCSYTPKSKSDVTFNRMTPSATNENSEYVDTIELTPTTSLVEEIYALIAVVNSEWIERMTALPKLLLRCKNIPVPELFRRGFETLQLCFRGDFKETFEDIFALIHVACAVAYSLHKDDDWYRWEYFFQDMRLWQETIAKESERGFFLQAMDCLAFPNDVPKHIPKRRNLADHSTFTQPCEMVSWDSYGSGALAELIENAFNMSWGLSQQYAGNVDRATTVGGLRNGRIMKDCSNFLDGMLPQTRFFLQSLTGGQILDIIVSLSGIEIYGLSILLGTHSRQRVTSQICLTK